MTKNWYENRHALESGQIFRASDGSIVQLDRSVPGDGTKWYVATWNTGWIYEDGTIEPGDLCGEPIEDNIDAIAKAAAQPL